MNICHISSEAIPYAKTGGLADVCGTLPKKMAAHNRVILILPFYNQLIQSTQKFEPIKQYEIPISNLKFRTTILETKVSNTFRVHFVRMDNFFNRPGLYSDAKGDYTDNFYRFLFFQKAAIRHLVELNESMDIIHCHDWQTAMIPILALHDTGASRFKNSRFVFTIHNIGYQGNFSKSHLNDLELPNYFNSPEYLEFYGRINFLKGGIVGADRITTVSPTYADEILTPDFGAGLDGFLQSYQRKLSGILNGVDYSEWNPATDPHVRQTYGPDSIEKKRSNKIAFLEEFNLPFNREFPLAVAITRLAEQKGIQLIIDAIEEKCEEQLSFCILGLGDPVYEERLEELEIRYPDRFKFLKAFDEKLSHKLQAAGDILLMPSKYEPCGLTQLYAMKYGTVPIVHATGGLKDTVNDFKIRSREGTGYLFHPAEQKEFTRAINRALRAFKNPSCWQSLQRNGMIQDFSWDRSVSRYLSLYDQVLKGENNESTNTSQ